MGYHILQISNGFNSFITLNLEFHALLTRLQISANFRRANLAIFIQVRNATLWPMNSTYRDLFYKNLWIPM